MGKMKEVFLKHQQEQEDTIERYYNELYKAGHAMGVEEVSIKEIINHKTKKNGSNKKRHA